MTTAAARPVVSVQLSEDEAQLNMPAILLTPIRPDVVRFVHTNMAKNSRQAYAVSWNAGHQTAAESWGTGRAVSRIPRAPGGGTHRAGQGAFGNMCRGGRMFNPTRVWRKWHRKVNRNQRRYALSSALAASALPALVMARGHRIESVQEVPLVVDDKLQGLEKTKNAVSMLKDLNVYDDVQKVIDSKKIRRGKGKMRNRRFVMRRGPLVVYSKDDGCSKAFRNLPGVETADVTRLNLLNLAPGGHLGRLVIWTASAFAQLDEIYGDHSGKTSSLKHGGRAYTLPRSIMTNSDITAIINSDEIQSVVKPADTSKTFATRKKNPLKNMSEMVKLNPYASAAKKAELKKRGSAASKKRKQLSGKEAEDRTQSKKTFFAYMLDEQGINDKKEDVADEEVEEEEEGMA